MIRIWKFNDAPQNYRHFYPRGSDSTWVLEVPSGMRSEMETIIDGNQKLSEISRRELPDGSLILFAQLPKDLTHEPRLGRNTKASGAVSGIS